MFDALWRHQSGSCCRDMPNGCISENDPTSMGTLRTRYLHWHRLLRGWTLRQNSSSGSRAGAGCATGHGGCRRAGRILQVTAIVVHRGGRGR
jgi:hypothetical protein